MSYLNRKWMVSFQDDGCLKDMNGWYYICDSDGGILLGYFKDKELAEEMAKRANMDGDKETEIKVRLFAANILNDTPLGYKTEQEHAILENFVDRTIGRICREPLDLKFTKD